MGQSYGDFVKYPRTPHLFGSTGTPDDKRMDESSSCRFIDDPSLIVEEKIDGTNVGIHFAENGEMVLQCRGHLITQGMHPQYDLFKQWTVFKSNTLKAMLANRYILFGEWLYACHSIKYTRLSHFFFEFDIYDKQEKHFLELSQRLEMLKGTNVETVPVVHQGTLDRKTLPKLIGQSQFGSRFENPFTGQVDNLMEGLYFRTEAGGAVTGRAKFVRPEFTEKIKQSTHWQQREMIPNQLAQDADIWS